MWKKVTAAVAAVAVLAAGVWYFMDRRSKAASAKNVTRIIPAKVEKGDIHVTVSGSGPVASVNGVMVKSNQQGTVAKLLAQDGDRVKAGQVIAVLDNDNLDASLKQAQIDLQNAQLAVDNILNPLGINVQAQRLKVENAKLTLQQRQQDMANLDVKAPQSGVIASVATTAGSSINNNTLLFTLYNDAAPTFVASIPQSAAAAVKPGMEAKVDLYGFGSVKGTVMPSASAATPTNNGRDSNVPVSITLPATKGVRPGMAGSVTITVPQLTYLVIGNGAIKNDSVEVRSQVAATVGELMVKEGDRVQAGDLLAKLTNDSIPTALQQAENDMKTQEQNLNDMVNPSQDPTGQLPNLLNKVQTAQVTLATRQSDYDDLQVKAPVDGQISSLTVRVGDRITTNQSLFFVGDYGAMQVKITVDELDVAKVKVGQKANLTLDALPGKRYTGKVIKVNPEGVFKNDIATFDVTVAIDKSDSLMAGMNSTVEIEVENKTGVLILPAQAVQRQGGRAFVQVRSATDPNQPTRKEVQIGLSTSTQVEITGGLNEGDEVILTIVRPSSAQSGGGFGGFMGGGGRPPEGGGQQVRVPAGGGGNFGGGGNSGGSNRQGGR